MTEPRVVHWVYDLIRGGTEGQCARVAMGLARRGMETRVAVFHRRGFFLQAVEETCGRVEEFSIRHLLRPATVREVRRMAAWLRGQQARLLHAWDADAAIFGQWAARWAGIPLITSRRDLGQIYPRWKMAALRRADRVASAVVANAHAIKTHFAATGVPPDKIEVIPNLLDLEEFDLLASQPLPVAHLLPPGRRLVVVNRLDPEKNTGLLIEALSRVRRAIPDAVLVVAGTGREQPQLERMARMAGVREAVCFLGEVVAIPSLLRLCEIGALVPSRNEGLSNTVLEYMAAELPVLATDCGGNRELVREGETGRLLPLQPPPAAVAAAWEELLRQPQAAREMGRRARKQVELHHNPQVILDRFQQLYQRVAARTGCGGNSIASIPDSG